MKKQVDTKKKLTLAEGEHRDAKGNVIVPEKAFLRLLSMMEVGSTNLEVILEQTKSFMWSMKSGGAPLGTILQEVSEDFALRAFLMECVVVGETTSMEEALELA